MGPLALTPEEYEQLIASRRQIGGQSARVRVLGQQVKRTEQLLPDLETLVATPAEGCARPDAGPEPGLPALRDSRTAAPPPRHGVMTSGARRYDAA